METLGMAISSTGELGSAATRPLLACLHEYHEKRDSFMPASAATRPQRCSGRTMYTLCKQRADGGTHLLSLTLGLSTPLAGTSMGSLEWGMMSK